MERKTRNKLSKHIDIMQPVTISMIGTEDDPCFGKHFDGKNSSCRRCGDSELCLIAMGMKTSKERKELESKGRFKDLEEAEYVIPISDVHNFLVNLLTNVESGKMEYSKAMALVKEKIYHNKVSREELKSTINSIIKDSTRIKRVKSGETKLLKLK